MIIQFDALGLSWKADVDYTPPGPPATITDESPPDPEELEFVALWNEHTQNAMWVLDSTAADDLYDAATEAARLQRRGGRSVFDEP